MVTDGQGTAQIIYPRQSSSYTSPLSTDTVAFSGTTSLTRTGEPDPGEAQASAAWTFSGPTPSFTCPASGHQTPVTLPKVDVTPSVLGATLVKKGLSVEFTDAAGRAAGVTELGAGNIGGHDDREPVRTAGEQVS